MGMCGKKACNGYDLLIIACVRQMLADYKRGDVSESKLRRFLTDDSIFVERFGSDYGQYILDHLEAVDLGNYNWCYGEFGGERYER